MLDQGQSDQKRPDSVLEEMLRAFDQHVQESKSQSSQLRQILSKLDHVTLSFEEPQPDGPDPMKAPSSHTEVLAVLLASLSGVNQMNQEIISQLEKII